MHVGGRRECVLFIQIIKKGKNDGYKMMTSKVYAMTQGQLIHISGGGGKKKKKKKEKKKKKNLLGVLFKKK